MVKWCGFLIALVFASVATGQGTPSGKTLAATMEVQVFPKAGQAATQQAQDEASCYEWAVGNVGHDPFELSNQATQQAQETEEAKADSQRKVAGSGVRGALRGAAAGAIIGEIADDNASEGAAIGAGVGAVAGRGRARRASRAATQQADTQGKASQEAIQSQMENFKNAFSVCLEAKDYLAKY